MKKFAPRLRSNNSMILVLCIMASMALILPGLSAASGYFTSRSAAPAGPVPAPFDSSTCGTCSAGAVTCSGQLIASGIPTSSRIERDLVGNTACGQGPSCGTAATGTFRYLSYVFTNDTGGASPDCFTVTLTTTCTGGTGLLSAAYLGSFNPSNVCTNNIADMGDNTNNVTSYQFNVANGQNFEIVVWNRTSNSFCASPFTLTLTPCAAVPGGSGATKVVFAQQPTDTVADQTITPAVTVQLQDGSSANVATPGIPITLTLTSGTGSLSGTTTQLTDAAGLATFNNLSINVTGTNKQLTASSGSLTPATSNFFNITQPAPVQCATCASGAISCSGQLIGHGTPTTSRKDIDGTTSTCANEACSGSTSGSFNYLSYTFRNSTASPVCYTVSFDNACNVSATSLFSAAYSPSFNPGNVCTNFLGDLGNPTSTTTSYQFTVPSGQNFDIVVWNRISGTYCTSPFTLTLTPCASLPPPTNATKLVFVQQPTDTVVDQTVTPAVTVQLQDNSSANVTDANIPITLSLTAGSGMLLGTTTQMTDATGLATFPNLSLNVVGNNKQLTASSSGLIPAVSSSFNITAAAAVPCNTCSAGSVSCSGQLIGHGAPATSRAAVDGIVSTCSNEVCSGSTAGTFNYLTYSFSNNSGASQCFTVSFDNACNTAATSLFSAAYSPSFDPNNVCTNFLGDLGNGTHITTSYSFTVANGQTFDVVVWNRNTNSYCTSPFTLTLTPCPCPAITGSVSGGGTICAGDSAMVTVTLTGGAPPYTVTLDNGGGVQTGSSPLNFTVSPSTTTTYSVTSATDSNGCLANVTGSATVTVNQPPTTATAGGPQTICANGTTSGLGGNSPAIGTGSWSVVSGGTGTFNPNSGTPNATFTHTGGSGPIVVRWTISNAPCPDSTADVTITINQAPTTATVGGPQTICSGGTTAGLGGNAPTSGTGSWSIVSGGTGTFNPNASSPNATFTHTGGAGPIVVRWTISNPPCPNSTADVTITIDQPPTQAAAGSDQTVCTSTATLAGNSPAVGAGMWTVISGPATVTTPSSPTSGVTGLGIGVNVFRWTISSGVCPASFDEVTITRNPVPTCTISGSSAVCAATTNAYSVTSSLSGSSFSWAISGNGSIVGPNTGSSVNVLAGASGSYMLTVTVSKDGCSSTCTLTATIGTVGVSCPANQTRSNDPGQCGAIVSYPPATSSCGTVVCSPASGSFFPVGTTTVTCTATDGSGNMASCSFTVTVNDTEAPQITLTTGTIELWPPNHSYHTITMSQLVASATDNCGGNVFNNVVITSVSSDEAENAPGNSDGNTVNDIVIAANCKSVQLRAERDDNLNGRVYTINLKATDAAGNMSTASRTVVVPVNQSGGGAILGPGPGYSVTCP